MVVVDPVTQPLPSDGEGDGEDRDCNDTEEIDDLNDTQSVPPAELTGGSRESVVIPNPQQLPFSQDAQSLGGLSQVPPTQDMFDMTSSSPHYLVLMARFSLRYREWLISLNTRKIDLVFKQ